MLQFRSHQRLVVQKLVQSLRPALERAGLDGQRLQNAVADCTGMLNAMARNMKCSVCLGIGHTRSNCWLLEQAQSSCRTYGCKETWGLYKAVVSAEEWERELAHD